MREEFHTSFIRLGSDGITPAHAGRIDKKMDSVYGVQDHPRACGKNMLHTLIFEQNTGSPPRMREEFDEKGLQSDKERDHPRACGKNEEYRNLVRLERGSPPRMREEFVTACVLECLVRITPAHAGRIGLHLFK